MLKVEESAQHSPLFCPQLRKTFFSGRFCHKPFLIWLLKVPPHLKYVTTAPCNLSLIAALVCDCRSFSDVNVSQGSVATHMRCSGISNKLVAANLGYWREYDNEKKVENWLRINTVTAVSLVSLFRNTVHINLCSRINGKKVRAVHTRLPSAGFRS